MTNDFVVDSSLMRTEKFLSIDAEAYSNFPVKALDKDIPEFKLAIKDQDKLVFDKGLTLMLTVFNMQRGSMSFTEAPGYVVANGEYNNFVLTKRTKHGSLMFDAIPHSGRSLEKQCSVIYRDIEFFSREIYKKEISEYIHVAPWSGIGNVNDRLVVKSCLRLLVDIGVQTTLNMLKNNTDRRVEDVNTLIRVITNHAGQIVNMSLVLEAENEVAFLTYDLTKVDNMLPQED
jgi:hypothetical protein